MDENSTCFRMCGVRLFDYALKNSKPRLHDSLIRYDYNVVIVFVELGPQKKIRVAAYEIWCSRKI